MTRNPMIEIGDLTHALTVLQPWASAIVLGPKPIENRGWKPHPSAVGNRIWIHAGKSYDEAGEESCFELWPAGERLANSLPSGLIIGHARYMGIVTQRSAISDEERRWHATDALGWYLEERKHLLTHVPARGMQGLWPVPRDVLEKLRREVRW